MVINRRKIYKQGWLPFSFMNRRQVLAGLGGLIGTCFSLESFAEEPSSNTPKKLPNIPILDMEGMVRDYSRQGFPVLDVPIKKGHKYPAGIGDYLKAINRPALLAFGAYKCGPCLEDMEDLNAMYRDATISQRVAIVGMNLAYYFEPLKDAITNTKAVLERKKVAYPNFMILDSDFGFAFLKLNGEALTMLPQNVLLNQNQEVVYISGSFYTFNSRGARFTSKDKATLMERINQLQ